MKQNLLIVSYDYDYTKRMAERLSESFSMRVFDQKELFEFDNLPFSFSELCEKQGKDFVLKKFRSILKMELDFQNAVFVADLAIADNCFDLFYKIKLSNFVVFLHKDLQTELLELSQKKFTNLCERDFYVLDKDVLKAREQLIVQDCADISVDVTGLSDEQVEQKVIEQMQMFYNS